MIGKQDFETMVEAQAVTLYRVSRSIVRCDADAKDAVQEAVLKAWAMRHTLRDEQAFPAWLTRILVNECRALIRKQARITPVEHMPEAIDPPPPDSSVRDALSNLPEKLRLPLLLHYLEGFSLKEISGMLRTPVGTLKWRLSQARKQLRLDLNDEPNIKEARQA